MALNKVQQQQHGLWRNLSICIGASCDAEEFVNYIEDSYYDQNNPGFSVKVESGARTVNQDALWGCSGLGSCHGWSCILELIQVLEKQHLVDKAYTYSYWPTTNDQRPSTIDHRTIQRSTDQCPPALHRRLHTLYQSINQPQANTSNATNSSSESKLIITDESSNESIIVIITNVIVIILRRFLAPVLLSVSFMSFAFSIYTIKSTHHYKKESDAIIYTQQMAWISISLLVA